MWNHRRALLEEDGAMNSWREPLRHFGWGMLAGALLVPLIYLARVLWKRRSERITIDDSEWP